MKKTFNINLAGQVFHIDDDAYHALQNYLDKISTYYKHNEEGQEIINDIEIRIAELFKERLEGRQVVSLTDVEEIISVLGSPEDIISEDPGFEEDEKQSYKKDEKYKRVYRDTDERIFGGVSAGIAAYFGLDPTLIRVLFIILIVISAGTGLIAYIILWAILPEARSTAQKLEMKGEKVNIENIEKSIREEYEGVKKNFRKYRNSSPGHKFGNAIEQIALSFAGIFKSLFKALGPILGVLLILAGISLILFFSGTFVFRNGLFELGNIHWSMIAPNTLLEWIAEPNTAGMLFTGLLMVLLVPLIGLFIGGFKLLFSIKSHSKLIGAFMGSIWFIGLILLIVGGISVARDFQVRESISNKIIIESDSSKTLTLFSPDSSRYNDNYMVVARDFRIGNKDDKRIFWIRPELDIKQSKDQTLYLEFENEARGMDFKHARAYARYIRYNYELKQDSLRFDPFFSLGKTNRWRDQELNMTLFIPVGQKIYMDESLEDIIYDIDNTEGIMDEDMLNEVWMMTPDGLKHISDN